jgi:tRNA A37 N6-isopentenylltransferase MiaA
MMSISFESEEIILEKLRERLRRMTDEELIKFGKDVRKLAENPFQRQLEEARAEWKRRKKRPVLAGKTSLYAKSAVQKFP